MIEDYGFPVGVRVIMSKKDPCDMVNVGMTGVVCDVVDEGEFAYHCNIGVRWDEGHGGYHDCNGNCEYRHGRYVPHTCLVLENIDLGEISCSDLSINALFT